MVRDWAPTWAIPELCGVWTRTGTPSMSSLAQLTTAVVSGTVKQEAAGPAQDQFSSPTCGFDFGGNIIMFSTDKQMGYQCFVSFFDLRDPSQIDSNEPYMRIPCNDSKITSAVWGPLGECIIAGHEGGELNQYSAKSGEVLVNVKEHSRQINDIQLSRDMTMFVTASKDNTAKLFDSTTLEHQKTFRTERPVNSAALSPNYDHVVLGGGQEAMDVTTTSTRIGKFEARFFHLAFEEEFEESRVTSDLSTVLPSILMARATAVAAKMVTSASTTSTHSTLNLSLKLNKPDLWEFPVGSVVRRLHFHYRGTGDLQASPCGHTHTKKPDLHLSQGHRSFWTL